MEVDVGRRGRAQHCAGGKVILGQHEAKWRDRVSDVIQLVELDDDVDILVLSGLHAQQRVDTPTAVQPDA